MGVEEGVGLRPSRCTPLLTALSCINNSINSREDQPIIYRLYHGTNDKLC